MKQIELIEHTINKIDALIKEQLPESKYQFELHDLATNTKHFRGLDEPFHWGSVYKLFVVAEILKKVDLKQISLSENIELKGSSKGSGVFHQLTNLKTISILDSCKLTIAISDALISDLLFQKAGNISINETLVKLDMHASKINDNLETIVSKIQPTHLEKIKSDFLYSKDFYQHYEKTLSELATKNFTTVKDINIGLYNLCNNFFSTELKNVFFEVIQMPNVWSRFSQYTYFSNRVKLFGKTGTLGFGIIANECAIIIDKENNSVLGYFSINTKDNKQTIYQVYDTIGLIGLEIVKLYEQLDKQTK